MMMMMMMIAVVSRDRPVGEGYLVQHDMLV